jgi:hypothetical protein
MDNWLPVAGTLAGAIVAASISFILHWMSNKHTQQIQQVSLSEERARWAVEHELARIQKFYGTIEKLSDAVQDIRIQQAWAGKDGSSPNWVLSAKSAREAFENALNSAYLEVLLLDSDMQAEYEKAHSKYNDWLLAETNEEGVTKLLQMGNDLANFRNSLGERYRKVFNDRKVGADIKETV